jgi:cytosine/adenosine deaminase-related metal-dependent hydrolase
MIRHVSAEFIIPVNGEPLRNGIVSFNNRGEIINLYERKDVGIISEPIEQLPGIIVPGFINTHCHLELSHMKGKVASGEGLIPFLTKVIKQRSASEKDIVEAMRQSDRDMQANGIVAVGDISNNLLSKSIKQASPIHYHTFVEFLGFNPGNAKTVYDSALDLLKSFLPLPASLAPHAPYSVSKELLKMFQKNTEGSHELTSMHNQECDDENELYRYKTGRFLDFYKTLNINIDFFKPQARNSIQSVIPLFASKQRILLVHNTYTSLKDVYFANRFNRDIHWCFCPKANIYIERKLPKIEMFLFPDFNITVGTDSLASNDKLCILSELRTIKEHFPSLSFTEILRWATINGARFLGIDHKYGSIEQGKTPGLNLITNTEGLELTADSEVQKIV